MIGSGARALVVVLSLGAGLLVGVNPASPSVTAAREAVTAAREATLVDTHTGTRAPHRALLGGETVSVHAFGAAGVPGDGAATARLRVRVDSASADGIIALRYADERDPHPVTISYAKSRTIERQVSVSLGQTGHLDVQNLSSARVQVHVWVTGYVPMATAGADAWTHSLGGDAGAAHSDPAAGQTTTTLARSRALYAAGGAATAVHVIAAGVLYTFADRGSDAAPRYGVRALDLKSGRTAWVVWAFTGDGPQQMALYGSYLYVTSWEQSTDNLRVTAIDLATRRVAWTNTVTAAPPYYTNAQTRGLVVNGGVVIVTTGYVDAFDAATGAHLWVSKDHTPAQTAAEDGHLMLPVDDGEAIVDVRTGRVLWTLIHAYGLVAMAGHRILVFEGSYVWAYSTFGCGKALCYPTWRASTGAPADAGYTKSGASMSATSTLIAMVIVTTTEPAGGGPSRQQVRYRTFDARSGASLADRVQSGPTGFSGGPPVIVGGAVLVNHARELDSMPADCHGFCALHTVLKYSESLPSTGDLVLAEGVLITGANDHNSTPTAFALG